MSSQLEAARAPLVLISGACLMTSVASTAFLLICFYPGNANIDIVFQARQAIGEVPYQNWHPPVVTFFREMLYRLTGTLGALFVFQAVLYGLSAWLLCLLIQRATGSAWLGLLGLLVPAAPWTLSQSTILWKDTQSALALLCSVLIIFFIRPHQPRSWWLMAPAGLLLIYVDHGTQERDLRAAADRDLPCLAVHPHAAEATRHRDRCRGVKPRSQSERV